MCYVLTRMARSRGGPHEAARVRHASRWCGGLAAGGKGAAAGAAGDSVRRDCRSIAVKQATRPERYGGMIMLHQSPTGAVALAVVLTISIGGVQAADDAKYPNWKGQWDTINPRFGG